MKRGSRGPLVPVFVSIVSFITVALILPGMPWSARLDRGLNRYIAKAKRRAAALNGHPAREALLSGTLMQNRMFPDPVIAADVAAVESPSGYASLTDAYGHFVIPHLIWFPAAKYNLLVAVNNSVRRLVAIAPPDFPEGGIMEAGQFFLDEARDSQPGMSPIRDMIYDRDNNSYYRGLFDRLAAGADTDHEKIDRICKFVATRLDHNETTWSFPTPMDIIVRGSGYCSNLALAMAAITSAGDFPTRTVHLSDNPEYTHSHVTVEVYYQDGWHLYDPTYGTHYLDRYGAVASYEELRLDPGLVRPEAFSALGNAEAREIFTWMIADFASGYNQIYMSVTDRLCNAW